MTDQDQNGSIRGAEIPDFILSEMLGDELASALFEARARCKDPSITARVEAGLVIVERGGEDQGAPVGHDQAVLDLGALI